MRLLRIKAHAANVKIWVGLFRTEDGKEFWWSLRDPVGLELTEERRQLNTQAVNFLLYTIGHTQATIEPVREIITNEIVEADNLEKRRMAPLKQQRQIDNIMRVLDKAIEKNSKLIEANNKLIEKNRIKYEDGI